MTDLQPCPGCRRHVRLDEVSCPFCAAALDGGEARSPSTTRLSRAAVFAGAALATVAAGCGGKQTTGPDNQVVENEATTVVDAAPTPDAAPVVQSPVDDYDNSCCMPYGAPPARERLV
jgi:hypothetical protein